MLEGLFSPWHIVVILTVALLVLGPDKLPNAARQIARNFREVREFSEHLNREARTMIQGDTTALPPSDGESDEQPHQTTHDEENT